MITTIERARQWGVRHLTRCGVPSPLRECLLLLAHAIGCAYERVIAYKPSSQLSVRVQWVFVWLIVRRGRGVPFAYLTHHKEFYGLDFYVNGAVLIPRPDSEALVTKVIKICTDSGEVPLSVHDCGCGSGALAIAIKHQMPHCHVTASDKSWRAIRVAQKNSECLMGTETRIMIQQYSLLDKAPRSIDIIVANLPYLTTQQMMEPTIAREPKLALSGGGSNGLAIIHAFIDQLPHHQSAGGIVIIEASLNQFNAIKQRLIAVGYGIETDVVDIAGIARAVCASKI